MADQTAFKHIQVTRSDDDVVVVAGAPKAAESAPADDPKPAAEAQPVSVPEAPRADAKVASEDAYRATTLQDIEESKMPTAQKVVLALAIAAVIAFIVWYAVGRL